MIGMIGRTIDQLAIGNAEELSRTARATDIAWLVDAVGDRNPVHSDRAFAASTPFREPIAPGIWTAGLISALIGTRLPGPGSIYVSQDLKFLRPVMLGDRITARVEVLELLRDRNRIKLRTVCVNQRGEEVLSGEAWVLPPQQPVHYAEARTALRLLSTGMFQPLAFAARSLSLWWQMGASALPLGIASHPAKHV